MRTLPLKIPGYAPDDEPYPRTQHNDPPKFWTPISRPGFQYANLLPRVLYHLIQENSQHLTKATFMSDRFDFLLTCLICWRKNSPSLTSWGKFLANFSQGEKYSGKRCYIDQINDCKYKKCKKERTQQICWKVQGFQSSLWTGRNIKLFRSHEILTNISRRQARQSFF